MVAGQVENRLIGASGAGVSVTRAATRQWLADLEARTGQKLVLVRRRLSQGLQQL
jgi:hypothetical protein